MTRRRWGNFPASAATARAPSSLLHATSRRYLLRPISGASSSITSSLRGRRWAMRSSCRSLRQHCLPAMRAIGMRRLWTTAHIKTQGANPSQRSAHHVHQKPFKGSEREVRGALLRRLTSGPESSSALAHSLPFLQDRIEKNLSALMKDGLISKKKNTYALVT